MRQVIDLRPVYHRKEKRIRRHRQCPPYPPGTPTGLPPRRGRRRQRVHQALAETRAQAAEITISSVAARARVHRSFIHRHPDLRAAVIAGAEDPATNGPAAASAVSRRSLLADNANLCERNRRLEQHVRGLEQRLSELLGTQISQRTGLARRLTSPR
jgi:hypothetical protein